MITRPAHTHARGSLLLPLALAAILALLAAAATAATPLTLQLNLQGGYANRELTACSLKHHYTLFHPRTAIASKGTLAPTPSGTWQVKVKVKQCLRGRFRTVWVRHTPGHTDGTFKLTYPAARSGYFFARAYYYRTTPATRSGKQYFRVG